MKARYVGTDGLKELVSRAADGTTAVKLLKGTWLAKTGYTRPERLPLRQQLEESCPEAFADAELLEQQPGTLKFKLTPHEKSLGSIFR